LPVPSPEPVVNCKSPPLALLPENAPPVLIWKVPPGGSVAEPSPLLNTALLLVAENADGLKAPLLFPSVITLVPADERMANSLPFMPSLFRVVVKVFVLGLTGVSIKNNSGVLDVKNNADTAYASVKSQDVTLFNNTAGFGNTIQSGATQAANYTYTLPLTDGTAGQVLQTDGSGVLDWVSAGSTAACWTVDSTALAFGSSSPVTMFTLPANAVIDSVIVIVDTAFDGTPTMSVGVNGGSASKYVGSGDVLLTVADRYEIPNQIAPVGTTEALEITYAAGGATVGAARVLVTYAVPT